MNITLMNSKEYIGAKIIFQRSNLFKLWSLSFSQCLGMRVAAAFAIYTGRAAAFIKKLINLDIFAVLQTS